MRAAAAIVMLLSAAEAAGAARRAAENATNAGRWGQTKGVMRSLFLLPEVKRGMETALELDPRFPPTYVLAGTVYYKCPGSSAAIWRSPSGSSGRASWWTAASPACASGSPAP